MKSDWLELKLISVAYNDETLSRLFEKVETVASYLKVRMHRCFYGKNCFAAYGEVNLKKILRPEINIDIEGSLVQKSEGPNVMIVNTLGFRKALHRKGNLKWDLEKIGNSYKLSVTP